MLIAMAGLPATGKSAIAARLAQALGGVVLCKDTVRTALFPPPVLDYSREQDDLCMAAIFSAAANILKTCPQQTVIIDGRTFLRSYQVRDLLACAASVNETVRIIECVCTDETARRRLEHDREQGGHPAGNRTFGMYLAVKTAADALALPRLVVDTGQLSLAECERRCLEFLGSGAGATPHQPERDPGRDVLSVNGQ